MNIKKLTVLVFLILVGMSCDDTSPVIENTECKSAIVNTEMFDVLDPDRFTIISSKLRDDCLYVEVGASGCNGDTWDMTLVGKDEVTVVHDNPAEREVRFSFVNLEICDGYFIKEFSFDLRKLQVPNTDTVILKLVDNSEMVVYRY